MNLSSEQPISRAGGFFTSLLVLIAIFGLAGFVLLQVTQFAASRRAFDNSIALAQIQRAQATTQIAEQSPKPIAQAAVAALTPLQEKGKALYATCAACHGANGEGNMAMSAPAISEQESWYIQAQLVKFKEGIRGTHPQDMEGMMMRPMTLALSDEDMQALAEYIPTLNAPRPLPTIEGDVKKGKALYATCVACHGDKAQGNPMLKAPALVGQHDAYLVKQLMKFKNGVRGSDLKDATGMQMVGIVQTLPDEQAMKDVVAYINKLGKE